MKQGMKDDEGWMLASRAQMEVVLERESKPTFIGLNGNLMMSKLTAGFLPIFHYLFNLLMPCDCHCVPLPMSRHLCLNFVSPFRDSYFYDKWCQKREEYIGGC